MMRAHNGGAPRPAKRRGTDASLEQVILDWGEEYLVSSPGIMGNCLAYRASYPILYLLLFCDLTVFFLCLAVCTSGIWREVHRETYSKLKVFISDPSTTMISIIIIITSTTINSTTITIPAPLPLNFPSSLPHQEHHLFQHQKSIQVSFALIPKWCIKSELI